MKLPRPSSAAARPGPVAGRWFVRGWLLVAGICASSDAWADDPADAAAGTQAMGDALEVAKQRAAIALLTARLEDGALQFTEADVLALALDVQRWRASSYSLQVERVWMQILARAIAIASGSSEGPPTRVSAGLAELIEQAPASFPGRDEALRSIRFVEVEVAYEQRLWLDVIARGSEWMSRHGTTPESTRMRSLIQEARWHRLTELCGLPTWTASHMDEAWHQTVMLEGSDRAVDSAALFMDALDRSALTLADNLERMVRAMERMSRSSPRLGRPEVVGRAHYIAAWRLWQTRDESSEGLSSSTQHAINIHLLDAAQDGYVDDPHRMILMMRLKAAQPFLIPVSLVGALGVVVMLRSRRVRRWKGARLLSLGHRYRQMGAFTEAAVCWAACAEALRMASAPTTRESLMLAEACMLLVRDAMERGSRSEAVQWADRIVALHPEFWPDGFEHLAARLGIPLQVSAGATAAP